MLGQMQALHEATNACFWKEMETTKPATYTAASPDCSHLPQDLVRIRTTPMGGVAANNSLPKNL